MTAGMTLVEGRPTRAEVDLDCIGHNVRLARRTVGPRTAVLAVVKADGYGHGAGPVARAALAAGALRLGVATVEEGAALRQEGIAAPVHVLGWVPPWQVEAALDHHLILTLFSADDARAVSEAAVRRGRRARVHLKVDTGMGRLGFPAGDPAVVERMLAVARLPGLEAEGIYTHFADSDGDRDFTLEQLGRFLAVTERLGAAGVSFALRHAANSGAVWHVPESHLDMVRLGISLYGYHPGGSPPPGLDLRPALTWKTAVAQVKAVPAGVPVSYGRTYVTAAPETLATLPVGYADGYSRALSNRGQVLLGGRRARVAGRVCMDQIVVSVPPGVAVRAGDEAVLIGRQDAEAITADDLARLLGTISYEVLCAIGKRVPRVYRGGMAAGGSGGGHPPERA